MLLALLMKRVLVGSFELSIEVQTVRVSVSLMDCEVGSCRSLLGPNTIRCTLVLAIGRLLLGPWILLLLLLWKDHIASDATGAGGVLVVVRTAAAVVARQTVPCYSRETVPCRSGHES